MELEAEFAETKESGEVYGKYELLDRIATGGMAEVFKAVSVSIGGFRKLVALKRILPHLSTDAEFVSLFIAEAKLAVSLTHGNIVQVFDFGRAGNNYYIAMELLDGRDMTQVLIKQSLRKKLVPIDVACFILVKSLLGLEYAHTRRGRDGEPLGIVHRDVSPHNILVSYDGEVKITDFGIAKAKTRVSLTRPRLILGKFAYMSPEQAKGLDVDARSDVYSAGVTLYETLTGRRLFYSDDPAQTLQKVRNPKVPLPSRYNPEITPELDKVVMTALAPEPEDRYPSARELGAALQAQLYACCPEFSDAHLAQFMKELFEDEVGADRFTMAAPRPRMKTERTTVRAEPARSPAPPSARTTAPLEDPLLLALAEKLRDEPNLWTVVEIGERLFKLDRERDAINAWRTAAVKFAQNGLLVQAVALYVQLRDRAGWNEELADGVKVLPTLVGKPNSQASTALPMLDSGEVGSLLQDLFHRSEPSGIAGELTTPLLSLLGPEEFANLVALLKLKRLAPGSTIMREGEPGDSLYIIARGRVIIYCLNFHGQKVYLSSLADGDCIGEFSFFTGEPRAATVETLDEVMLFEIAQKDFDTILEDFPNLTNALLQFYKERVVATLLAKSEVFGVLPAKARTSLLDRLKLVHAERGDVVITEGERSDGFYLIKSGEVEVYSEKTGYVFLSKLKSGEFFGEIAAITGEPRTASVRALGPCELLRLSGADLQELGKISPEMKTILENRIAMREAETARRMTAGGLLI